MSKVSYLIVVGHQYLQGLYTLGMDLKGMLGYIDLVREQLLRHVNPSPHMLYDEMIAAFKDILPQDFGMCGL